MADEIKVDMEKGDRPKVIKIKSPNYVHIYSNNAEFGTSIWDIRVSFAEVIGNPEDEPNTLLVEQRAEVVMSPTHAKVFAQMMVNSIKQYEAQYGEIKIIRNTVINWEEGRELTQ